MPNAQNDFRIHRGEALRDIGRFGSYGVIAEDIAFDANGAFGLLGAVVNVSRRILVSDNFHRRENGLRPNKASGPLKSRWKRTPSAFISKRDHACRAVPNLWQDED